MKQADEKLSVLDEINEALVTNEALMAVLRTGELPFNLLNTRDLNGMSIDQLKSILASASASDVVRKKATSLVNAYENKRRAWEAEGKYSPKEIEDQALKALAIAKVAWGGEE